MPQALVVGSPISHSLSPALHAAGYRTLGLDDWSYGSHEVTADGLGAFLRSLPEAVRGLSVTMPDKEAALELADASSALAREVGAANTLLRNDDGWYADNTDVAGVLHALLDAGCMNAEAAVVVGSGATARSAVAALAELGVRETTFLVRACARPETIALAERYDMSVDVVSADRWADTSTLDVLRAAQVLVATTPAHAADSLADVVRSAQAPKYVFDVVYADWPTVLAQAAREAGAVVVSGLDMLVHQAAVQFEMFTGRAAPISDMKAAGLAAVK